MLTLHEPTHEGVPCHQNVRRFKAVPFNPADVANIAKSNPYIQRLIEDAQLRDNVQKAIESSQERVRAPAATARPPAKALLEDKKLQGDLRHALEAVRDAIDRADRGAQEAGSQGPPPRSQAAGRRARRRLALAGSEKLRSKVLDALFGAEEEFEYTPPPGSGVDSAGHAGQRRLAISLERETGLAPRAPTRAPSAFVCGQDLVAAVGLEVLDRLADGHARCAVDSGSQPPVDGLGVALPHLPEHPADRLSDEELPLLEHRVGVAGETVKRGAVLDRSQLGEERRPADPEIRMPRPGVELESPPRGARTSSVPRTPAASGSTSAHVSAPPISSCSSGRSEGPTSCGYVCSASTAPRRHSNTGRDHSARTRPISCACVSSLCPVANVRTSARSSPTVVPRCTRSLFR